MVDLKHTVWQSPPAEIDHAGHSTTLMSGIAKNPYPDPSQRVLRTEPAANRGK